MAVSYSSSVLAMTKNPMVYDHDHMVEYIRALFGKRSTYGTGAQSDEFSMFSELFDVVVDDSLNVPCNVGPVGEKYEIRIMPFHKLLKFFSESSKLTLRGISSVPLRILILHEILHVALKHFQRFPNELSCRFDINSGSEKCKRCGDNAKCQSNFDAWSKACDLAVNSIIANSSTIAAMGGIHPGQRQFRMPHCLTAGEYYELLKKRKDNQKKEAKAGGKEGKGEARDSASHERGYSSFEDFEKAAKSFKQEKKSMSMHDPCVEIEENMKNNASIEAMKKFVDKQIKSHDNYPGKDTLVSNLITILAAGDAYDIKWERVIQQTVSSTRDIELRQKWSRQDRRYGTTPGAYVKMRQKIVVAVDTSASINKRTYQEMILQINRLNIRFDLIECDDKIQRITEQFSPNMMSNGYTFLGGGGTQFDPVIKYCNATKPSLLIYLTDGFGHLDIKPQIPVVWAIIGPVEHLSSVGSWFDSEVADKTGRKILIPVTG